MKYKKTRAVIFDMDGVLTETSEQHFIAWKQLADKIGVEIDREFNEKLKGVSRMECLDIIMEKGQLTDKYSQEKKNELATQKNDNYRELIQSISRKDLFEGAVEIFDVLKRNNIKIGLASASKNAETLLNKMEIRDYFDVIVDPASLKNGKPNPEIFLKAAKALSVDPAECIGVEDAEAGIEAINRAGMQSIGIGEKNILTEADLVYSQLKEVPAELFL